MNRATQPLTRVAFRLPCVVLAATSAALAMDTVRAETKADDEPPTVQRSAAVLSLRGMITDVMYESLARRFEDAKAAGADLIILDMDTPGGLVTSSIAIADLVKNQTDVKTIAWVNPNAHSGGTIVAVACNEIVMAQSSRMGDSQVIMGGPGGATAVPEEIQPKVYTPVLAEFRASARLRGYDQVLCEAFVLPQREVWWLENTKTGAREFVFREEKVRRLGESPKSPAASDKDAAPADDDAASAVDDGGAVAGDNGAPSEWKLVATYYDPLLEMEVDAIQPVVPDNQLLEMSAAEAHAYGFSKGVVRSQEELETRYALTSVVRLAPTWSEALAYWLTSMYVRGFLLVIILLGAYVEFNTPGVGVPGLVALIALAIFVGAPYLAGLASVWELVLIGVGIALIMLEVFVIPGFGVPGISGVLLLLVGLIATFVPDEPGHDFPIYIPSLPSTMDWLRGALITMASSTVASLVGIFILSKYLPKTSVFHRFAPANPTPAEVLVSDPYRGAARVGDMGRTEGPLHPSGKARFEGVLVDVVSQGEFLDGGVNVEVIERRGNRVVVRAMRPPGAFESANT